MPVDVMKALEADRKAQSERFEKIRAWAIMQGFLIVKESARRYLIVDLGPAGSSGCWQKFSGLDATGTFFTALEAELKFRGSWGDCRRWIEENGKPLPPELCPR